MKNSNWQFLVRLVIILVIASVLAWMIFSGGCLDNTRIKLHSSNFKTDIMILCMVFAGVADILF